MKKILTALIALLLLAAPAVNAAKPNTFSTIDGASTLNVGEPLYITTTTTSSTDNLFGKLDCSGTVLYDQGFISFTQPAQMYTEFTPIVSGQCRFSAVYLNGNTERELKGSSIIVTIN